MPVIPFFLKGYVYNNKKLGDNCIQNFLLGRYIRRYTSPNENFEYGYPHSYALLQFELKLERCKPHKATRHLTKCDVINDVKLFPIVYRRIYCRKFLTLSNQTSRYKLMCIRIHKICKQFKSAEAIYFVLVNQQNEEITKAF